MLQPLEAPLKVDLDHTSIINFLQNLTICGMLSALSSQMCKTVIIPDVQNVQSCPQPSVNKTMHLAARAHSRGL